MNKTARVLALSLALFFCAVASVRAGTLLPGDSLAPLPFGAVSAGATLVADTGDLSYTLLAGSTVKGTGTIRESVFSGDTNNPNAGLTFIFEITDVKTGDIGRLTSDGYAGWATDVVTGSGSVAPESETRSTLLSDGGDTVGFNFHPQVDVGRSSSFMIIRTDAAGYGPGDIGLLDSGIDSLQGFSPTATSTAVPEPSSLVMFLCMAGLAGAYSVSRRANSAAQSQSV